MFQRTRWTALGAAVAVVVGAGAVMPSASAAVSSGDRAVFVPVEPCRLFDTRSGGSNVGPRATPIGAAESYIQQVTGANGHCVVPADASAVSLNVTTVDGTAASYLTVYPADAAAVPLASNLNWTPGAPPTPNKVDVKLSATGAIGIFNNAGSVNVLADVVGYYADHNHDDRYYTKAEIDATVNDTLRTEVHGSYDARWEQPAVFNQSINNTCVGNTTGSGVFAEIPITMPVGSRLISVDTLVLDGVGPTTYSVDLIKTTITTLGVTVNHLGFVSGLGGGTGLVHTLITPAGSEIAAPGVSYALRVGDFFLSQNHFCQVTVNYDTKP
ncbi:MAG TPA: hypothetical protein VHQ23_18950 [Ilumatobacteraceae bacterium]|nr:hypothetical protein [Ilumatobacteraceae bacterium]